MVASLVSRRVLCSSAASKQEHRVCEEAELNSHSPYCLFSLHYSSIVLLSNYKIQEVVAATLSNLEQVYLFTSLLTRESNHEDV